MKALVLCGGYPQMALLKELKLRGIETVLADANSAVVARPYADKFYQVSVLDVEAVKDVAIKEQVDFLITVCADQVLLVVAQISETLGLPCYIDYATADKVSKKSLMKKIFAENGVPTSKYVVMESFDAEMIKGLEYPLIVKPVDAYSSRGVCRVDDPKCLKEAFERAADISRTKNAIVEEFVEGNELTVDVYVEQGTAHVLSIANLDKIGEDGKFVIHRAKNPADISAQTRERIAYAAQRIADAFGLKNTPMLIQLIDKGEDISVVEFCARTGGGDKYRIIKVVSGFDVVKAVVDLTLGKFPHVEKNTKKQDYIIDEFLYCKEGVFDRLEGFDELVNENIMEMYCQLKPKGYKFKEINSSGDRVAYFSIQAKTAEEAWKKHTIVNERIKVISTEGEDILRHDVIAKR